MKPSKPLVFYAVAFYIGSISYIVFTKSVFTGAVLAASFLIIILLTIDKKFFILVLCFFAAGSAGIMVYYRAVYVDKVEIIRIIKNKDYYCVGIVNGRNINLKGDLEDINEGDRIFAQGKLESEIDYSRGIVGTFYVDDYKLLKSDAISRLYEIKRNSYKEFERYLGKEKAAVVMSLCFGETGYLSDEQKYDFQELGVVHAISVSGFHMAVIYKLLEGIAGFKVSMIISFIYMIFTGTQPATIRAFLMIFVLKLSKKVFRNYDGLSALSLSALIILAVRPYYVLDVGFILSYMATLGILLYYDKIRRTFFKLPKSINESLSLTLSAQVFSLAYSGMVFNNVSFGFLLGNIILLPMYTLLVIAGNSALMLIKLKYLFSFTCYILNIIMLAVEGASFLLLKLTPPVQDISYSTSLLSLIIIVSFILYKKGFGKFKAVPIFVLGVLILQSYYFFPRIDYVNLGGRDGVIISYKSERVLIHNQSKEISNKESGKFTKVVSNPIDDLLLRLGKNYSIRIPAVREYDKDSINIEISAYESKTILTRNTEDYMDIDLNKYDIIKLPKQGFYPFNGKFTDKIPRRSYAVIFAKVYTLHGD